MFSNGARLMRAAIAVLAPLCVVFGAVPATASAAAPRFKAQASVPNTSPVRLRVVLSSRHRLTSRTRVRAVRAKVGGRWYNLRRVSATRRSSVWRTRLQHGPRRLAIQRAPGHLVVLKVRTRAGRRTIVVRCRKPRLGSSPAPGSDNAPAPGAPGGSVPGSTTQPPPPITAPPPVVRAPDRFVSTTGDDGGTCTQAAPCRTFQRAYTVANPGELVQVAGGDYPAQTIDGTKASDARITFRAAPGATVTVGMGADNCTSLRVNVSHVEFDRMTTEEACADAPLRANVDQTDVTFRNIRAFNGLQVNSTTNVSFVGGDYGPSDGSYQNWNNGIRSVGTEPANILIDGAKVHDVACSPSDAGCHIECLIVGAVNGLTIRNSTFYHCPIMGVFFETFNGPISNVTFENNFMADSTEPTGGDGTGRPSIMFKGNSTITNVLVRFNSLYGPLAFEPGGNPVNARVIGNVGTTNGYPCNPDVGYAYNVWSDGPCGSTDVTGSSAQWVRASSGADLDYHLKAGARAIDLVPNLGPDYALGTDIDGQARPIGPRRDAGADERG